MTLMLLRSKFNLTANSSNLELIANSKMEDFKRSNVKMISEDD